MEFEVFMLLLFLPRIRPSKLGCGGHCLNKTTDCLDGLACRNKSCTDDPALGTGAAICYASNGGRGYQGCGALCYNDEDCIGKLVCLNRLCDDDPNLETNICTLLDLPPVSGPIPGADINPGCGANCEGIYGYCITSLACVNGTCTDQPGAETHICSSKKNHSAIIGGVLGSVLGFVVILGFMVWWYYDTYGLFGDGKLRVRRYRLAEVRQMTADFSEKNVIGQGGFGTVYVGYPKKGSAMALKRERKDVRISSKVFLEEVGILERIHHRHIVDFKGFCDEKGEHMLLFEFMSKGNLRQVLHEAKDMVLTWQMRVKTAYHVACGLDYLHHGADPSIIHLDVKPENVLLDAEYTAKVSDFGISKTGRPGDTTFRTTDVSCLGGSRGYMDPSLSVDYTLSTKNDVYSFGVLVLEIISGQRAMRIYQTGSAVSSSSRHSSDVEEILLVNWVRRKFEEEKQELKLLLDPALQGCCDEDEFITLFHLGLACTQQNREDRPTMALVKKSMEDKLFRSLMPEHTVEAFTSQESALLDAYP